MPIMLLQWSTETLIEFRLAGTEQGMTYFLVRFINIMTMLIVNLINKNIIFNSLSKHFVQRGCREYALSSTLVTPDK